MSKTWEQLTLSLFDCCAEDSPVKTSPAQERARALLEAAAVCGQRNRARREAGPLIGVGASGGRAIVGRAMPDDAAGAVAGPVCRVEPDALLDEVFEGWGCTMCVARLSVRFG